MACLSSNTVLSVVIEIWSFSSLGPKALLSSSVSGVKGGAADAPLTLIWISGAGASSDMVVSGYKACQLRNRNLGWLRNTNRRSSMYSQDPTHVPGPTSSTFHHQPYDQCIRSFSLLLQPLPSPSTRKTSLSHLAHARASFPLARPVTATSESELPGNKSVCLGLPKSQHQLLLRIGPVHCRWECLLEGTLQR